MSALACGPAFATERPVLERPKGHVILTVTGNIGVTNDGTNAEFDLDMLRALGRHVVRTRTPWTEGVSTFEGPLLRDVLAAVGARGRVVRAVALNDYKVDIPATDYAVNDVIVAYSLDDRVLSVREKGPLWVIYPWDDVPDLRGEVTYARSIWQMTRITVQ